VAESWPPESHPDDLVVRAGSTVKRDAYKAAAAGLTGVTAFGALAVTGTVAGTAAHEQALRDSARPAQPAAPPQVVLERRKHRTGVRPRVVHEASSAGSARPSTGGGLSGGSTATHQSSGSVPHSAPRPRPAAPAPAPAPAPSSGS
jgi:hypothetical protein